MDETQQRGILLDLVAVVPFLTGAIDVLPWRMVLAMYLALLLAVILRLPTESEESE